jgi:hypothetical protein
MTNEDVTDLYDRIPIGTKVVVLGAGTSSETAKPMDPSSLTASRHHASSGSSVLASQQR